MRRADWIWLAVGVVAALGLVALAAARDVPMNVPFWALIVLTALMPFARSYGSCRAQETGRGLRKRRRAR